jgi:hypothetical protein
VKILDNLVHIDKIIMNTLFLMKAVWLNEIR